MQSNLGLDDTPTGQGSERTPNIERSVLAELEAEPLGEKALHERVARTVPGLSTKAFKLVLKALIEVRKIHGRPRLGAKGKPTKAIEAYVLGAPPLQPAPRTLAPAEVLAALRGGALAPSELKKRVTAAARGLAAKDYTAILNALVVKGEIHGRAKLGKNGKPTKTVESYALGPPPPPDPTPFLDPFLARWRKTVEEANAVGISEEALVMGLAQALKLNGLAPIAAGIEGKDDREHVLLHVREMVAREGAGALISIRQLRALTHLEKHRFDAAVLRLRDEDVIILHHHDYVGNLDEAERAGLVVDQYNNHYVGIALRGGP